ncbi:hypothetical protein TNCV_4710911 [Trichonephila clavipes]|uniref:Uncharacterized protein n=1 Tax=Trichonephila clavipes TaxID=2585209 RepID=A0A8X6V5Q4_TRICX|nr:hypothetical protein TNCV_4710911 [Trichonephila clavipes]
MTAPSSSFIPTPLAHADNQGEGHPRGAPLQCVESIKTTCVKSHRNVGSRNCRSCEFGAKKQRKEDQHIKRTKNILWKSITKTGAQNYYQKSSTWPEMVLHGTSYLLEDSS